MKKKILIALMLLTAAAAVLLAACGSDTTGGKNTKATTAKNSAYTAQSKTTEAPETKKGREAHEEYVETYYVYAERGAVVTWFDPQTGQFRYKDKCEECGKIASGEHSGSQYVHPRSSYSAGFTCTNPDCSMWGKSQRAEIGCSSTGEYIEVWD